MFDEPSSYLDVKQRLRAASTIRGIIAPDGTTESSQRYVLVVEHDLAVLDYLSDYICCLYGTPRYKIACCTVRILHLKFTSQFLVLHSKKLA